MTNTTNTHPFVQCLMVHLRLNGAVWQAMEDGGGGKVSWLCIFRFFNCPKVHVV